jgi:leader peptidase (prepilin peptidase) / N-methyltransferase
VIAAVVLAWLAVLSCYDLRQRRLPNALTLPGAALILLGCAIAGRGMPALLGAVALTAVYLSVHLVDPAGMGGGDVKLAIGLGGLSGYFGAGAWLLAALGAPMLTALVATMCCRRSLPHGPSMCVATAAAAGLAWLG